MEFMHGIKEKYKLNRFKFFSQKNYMKKRSENLLSVTVCECE